jgi:hypothetical protein
MYRYVALALFTFAVSGAAPAQTVPLSPVAKKDLQCFLLLAAAVGMAEDRAEKDAGSVGVAYFYGRLQAQAPGLDLVRAARRELAMFDDQAEAEKVGAACDAEVAAFGNALIKFGDDLQKSGN